MGGLLPFPLQSRNVPHWRREPPFRCEREIGFTALSALRQTLHQRLRLGDLGHFGRRRKTFERAGEDGARFGLPKSRLIKLRERQRGAQAEAARALPFRDGDGGSERFLGVRMIGGTGLKQDLAFTAQ